MARGTLNISLSPSLTEFVRERVSSGLYASASEVVREALRWFAASDDACRAPTLPVLQEQGVDRDKARAAVARLRDLRQRSQLGPDVTIAELRDEDRR